MGETIDEIVLCGEIDRRSGSSGGDEEGERETSRLEGKASTGEMP